MERGGSILLAAGWLAATGAAAWAQSGTPAPVGGQIIRDATFRPTAEARPLGPAPEVRFTSQTPPENADRILFDLRDVDLAGGTIYADEDLRGVYAEKLGRRVSLLDVFAIAADVQARYRADGYLFTRVLVPAQRIENGAVRIEIVEAVLEEVAIEEPESPLGPVRDLARGLIAPLKGLRNPRLDQIESVLLSLNDIPGVYRAAAVPKLGDSERGAIKLFINMERDPWDVTLFADNRQPPITGTFQFGVVASANSWSSHGDTTTVSYFNSGGFDDPFPDDFKERWTVQVDHLHFFDDSGLNLRLRALRSESLPGDSVADFNISGDQTELEAALYAPVVRSRALRLDAFAAFEAVEVNGFTPGLGLGGGAPIGEGRLTADDSLRVLSLGLDWLQRDDAGSSQGRVELRRGTPFLGASSAGDPGLSREDGSADFVLIRAEVQRVLTVTDHVDVWLYAAGQLANRPLLASEEFSIGGPRLGRAFDIAEYSGDNGGGVSGELRYNFDFNLGSWRVPAVLYGYSDFAEIHNLRGGVPNHAAVISGGGGVRALLPGDVAINLEAAKPINQPRGYNESDTWRFFFGASVRF